MPVVVIGQSGQGNRVGSVINNGGGLAVQNSGLINHIASYYPTVGASIPPTVTVFESGGSVVVNAIRNNDGVIIASGDFDAVIQTAVLETAKSNGTLLIKAGSYSVSSGITMSGDIRLMGEGHGTSLQCDLGCTSGVIKMREGFQEVSDLELQTLSGTMIGIYMHTGLIYASINNVFLDGAGPGSGTKGIFVNNNGPFNITNIKEIQNFGTGIYLEGTSAEENCIDNVRFVGCDAGIRLVRSRRNRIDNIYGESYTTGVVILESGSTHNTVSNIIGRSTSLPVVVAQTSGLNNVISNVINVSGGPTVAISGAQNEVGATFPKIGILTPQHYTIWESGNVYAAMRNTDGVMLASGTNMADIFKTVLDQSITGGGGIIQLKRGGYLMTSGVSISGDVTIQGEGVPTTSIDVSGITGTVSGLFNIMDNGVTIKDILMNMSSGVMKVINIPLDVTNVFLDRLEINGPGQSESGTNAVYFQTGFDCRVQNCNFDSFDEGIRLDNTVGSPNNIQIDNMVIYNTNTSIMLDNVASNQITNIEADGTTSGAIILQGSLTKRNMINHISASSSGIPVVVVKTSGENNRITNIESRSTSSPLIVDLTSGTRNFMLPGMLDPTVLISGASPFTYVNASGRQEMITVGGGTVSLIEFVRRGTTTALSGLTAGTFILNGGDKLTVTYSAAPAIKVIPTG